MRQEIRDLKERGFAALQLDIDPGAIQLVGDFTGAGHAEVLFINSA